MRLVETPAVSFPSWGISYQSNGKCHFHTFLSSPLTCTSLGSIFLKRLLPAAWMGPIQYGSSCLLCYLISSPLVTLASLIVYLLPTLGPLHECSLWLGFLTCIILPAFFLISNSPFRLDLLGFLRYHHFLGIVCKYLFMTMWLLSISHGGQKLHVHDSCYSYLGPLLASSTQWHSLFLVDESVNEWMNGSFCHHIMYSSSSVLVFHCCEETWAMAAHI